MTSPFDHVAALAEALASAGIDVLELTGPAGHVRIRRSGAPRPSGMPAHPHLAEPKNAAADIVRSPGVGHFLHAHPLHEAPLVEAEDAVTTGQTVGLLRVGQLLLPVTSPRDGIVREHLAEDGTLVGFGDPLLSLWPAN